MTGWRSLFACLFAASLLVVPTSVWAEDDETDWEVTETRGVSMWPGEFTAGSGADPADHRAVADQTLDDLEEAGINTVYAITFWMRAFYPTDEFVTDARVSDDYDPIAYFKQETQDRGMEFHAWFVNARASQTYNPHIYDDHLDWFLRNPAGERHDDRLDYAHDEVRQREYDIMTGFVEKYPDIDGLQFDYIRYPFAGDYYYSDAVRDGFEDQTGIDPLDMYENPGDYSDDDHQAFQQFLEEQPTQLVEDVYETIQDINPDVQLGAAVMSPASRIENAKQPWPQWLEDGVLDYLKPMWYSFGLHNYEVTHLTWWIDVAGDEFDRLVLPVGLNHEDLNEDPEANFPVVEFLRDFDGVGQFFFRWNHENMPDDWGERAGNDIYERDARPYSHLTFSNDPDDPEARILVATSEDRVTRLFGLRNLLREHGYAVDVTADHAGQTPPDELADDYDLVWFAREALPDDYDDQWDQLEVPSIVSTPFVARDWGWGDEEVTGDEQTTYETVDPDHSIVTGDVVDGQPLADQQGDEIQWRGDEHTLYSVADVVDGHLLLTQGDEEVAPALAVWDPDELDGVEQRRAFLNIDFEVYLDWKNDDNDRDAYATNLDVLTDDGTEVVLRTLAWALEESDEDDDDGEYYGPDAGHDDTGPGEPDAGEPEDTGPSSDTGDDQTEPGGCGCSTGGGAPTGFVVVALALLGLRGKAAKARECPSAEVRR